MKISRMMNGLAAVSLLLGIMVSTPVQALGAETNGAIAYTKTIQGKTNVWLMNADGSNKRALTKNGANQPAWSPNGKKLAYVDSAWGIQRLQVTNADGTQTKTLALHVSTDEKPAWSADGKRVAFTKIVNSKSAVYAVDVSGQNSKNISGWSWQHDFGSPSFSPDGNRIVYQKYSTSGSYLVIKNLANGYVRTLTEMSDNVPARASWSPNGKKILFNDSSDLVYTIWPDGSHRAVISDGESYHASWSPDGSRLAFIEDAGDDFISISEPDGTVVWMLVQKGEYREIGAPTWSPDGTTLLFTLRYSNDATTVSDIFSMKLDESPAVTHLASGQLGSMSWQRR